MECHVQCLSEKIGKLEKSLPQNDEAKPYKLPVRVNSFINRNKDIVVCPVEDLVHKEKILRKNINNVNKSCIPVTTNVIFNGEKKSVNEYCTYPNKNRKVIRKERLLLLEDYGKKLCNNLQSIKNNQLVLKKKTQHLSKILDKRQKCSEKQNKNQYSVHDKENIQEFAMKDNSLSTEYNDLVGCDTVEWHRNVKDIRQLKESKKCANANEVPLNTEKYTSSDGSSSSESCQDESCECQHFREEHLNHTYHCICNNADTQSVSSNSSNEESILESEKNNHACFCNSNDSHKDLQIKTNKIGHVEKEFTKNTSTDICQDNSDAINKKSKFLNVQNNTTLQNKYPIFQNTILNRLKVENIEDVQEDLRRLKIRNHNFKNFLCTLENPLNIINERSEMNSLCTTVSSRYTVDLDNQTQTSLITVVKVLESKCRNKDVIIAALADELRMVGGKKLSFKNNKSEVKKMNNSKNLDKKKEMKRIFNTRDSVIGFLFLMTLIISHLKTSQTIFYLQTSKKYISEYIIQVFKFMKEAKKLFPNYYLKYYEKLNRITVLSWKEINKWFGVSFRLLYTETYKTLILAIIFVIENQRYIAFSASVIFSIVVIINSRKSLLNNLKISKSFEREQISNLFKPIKSIVPMFLRIVSHRLLSSRIFWLALGYCIHLLWNMIQGDYIRLLDSIGIHYIDNEKIAYEDDLEKQITQVITEEPMEKSFEYLDYSQFFSIFSVKFQNFVDSLYHILVSVIV